MFICKYDAIDKFHELFLSVIAKPTVCTFRSLLVPYSVAIMGSWFSILRFMYCRVLFFA